MYRRKASKEPAHRGAHERRRRRAQTAARAERRGRTHRQSARYARRRSLRCESASAHVRRLRRSGHRRREPSDIDRRGEAPRRAARTRALLRAARAGKDDAGRPDRARTRRELSPDQRPDARETERSSRHPHALWKTATCSSSTRFTGSDASSKSFYIRRWKIFRSTSWSTAARTPRR